MSIRTAPEARPTDAAAATPPTGASPRDTGAPQAPRRRRGGGLGINRRPGWFVYAILLVVLLGSAYPFWWSFVIGSRNNQALGSAWPPLIPGGNFWSNAAKVFDAIPFWQALANSLIVSSVITVSVVSFATLAGYAFAKLRFKGRNGLMVAVIATMAIPTQLGIIPLFILMRQWGWTGELGAVIVPTLVTAFGVFFMRQYLVDVIPDELIEAARVDGANMIRTFFHVGLPAARPAMAILGLFTFMTAWTDYLWPMLVLPNNPTLQVALGQLQSGYYVDFSIVLTGAMLSTLPLLVLFLIAGKQLISGIMQGAVKG